MFQSCCLNKPTRRYPWGIQGDISLHTPVPDQLNPKCQDLAKSDLGGGGGVIQTNIPEILEWRHSRNFEHKSCHAILWKPLHHRVSHTTCVETNKSHQFDTLLEMDTLLDLIYYQFDFNADTMDGSISRLCPPLPSPP